eukprot:UN33606
MDKCGRLVTYEKLGRFQPDYCFDDKRWEQYKLCIAEGSKRLWSIKDKLIKERGICCNQTISVVDLTELSYFATYRNKTRYLEILELLSVHFPDQLKCNLFINSPTLFRGIYEFSIRMPFVKQRTIDKTKVLGTDFTRTS